MRVSFVKEIYKNEENGYCVFKYVAETDSLPENIREGYFSLWQEITAVGYFLPSNKKIDYEMEGMWKKDKYGFSFVVTSFEDVVPENKEGIIAYLSSGLIKGVGEKTAKLIVGRFGLKTMEVFENSPEDLLEIKGISKGKLEKIINSYQSTKTVKALVAFLKPYGITTNSILRIYRKFGTGAMHVIQENPFLLCDVEGFGFKTVDDIAENLNYPPDGEKRIESSIIYSLDQAKRNGHLYLNYDVLIEDAFGLLNKKFNRVVVQKKEIESAVNKLSDLEVLVVENKAVYKYSCHHAEENAAFNIRRLLKANGERYFVSSDEIEALENYFEMTFAEKQKKAISMCLANNISIVTGGPGTGKSTILKAVLRLYQTFSRGEAALLAPTGKAARRMEECTGFPASTIHSALCLHSDEDESFGGSALDASLVVVDEFSMVDMSLAKNLFSSIRSGAKVLLIGDPDQLPSVGAGNVFRELINSHEIPTTVLDVVYRQSGVSKIITNAVKINTGKQDLEYDETFSLTQISSETKAADEIVKMYVEEVKKVGIENVQVITPLRKKGEACSNALNKKIQAILNPALSLHKEIQIGERFFREKDRIMQIKNNDFASNGETGEIISISPNEDDEPIITIRFSSGRVAQYTTEDMDIIDLGYATTVHKSQGSEYKTVILAMLSSQFIMLKRNLLYTAVTRAKENVFIVGDKPAISMAIKKNDIDKRNTKLAERLQYFCEH